MYEIEAANFRKGTFEIHLRNIRNFGPFKWLIELGPVKGRLVAMGGLLFSLMLSLNKAPSRFILENGYAPDMDSALLIQQNIMWGIAVVFGVFYLSVFLFRREELELDFDRTKDILYYHHTPCFFLLPRRSGSWAFRDIRKIQVIAPENEPKSPYGVIEIEGPATAPSAYRSFRFRVLSEDQIKIFPLNISNLVGREPSGDWVSPDSLPPDASF